MFKPEMLHFYPLNELISNLIPATGRKKVGMGPQRAEKARNFENIQLGEHLATNYVNWHQICNMISYKRDVLERQSLSEVEMDRGSPICERVRKKIVEYLKKTAFFPKAKALEISSSTVHNIIKRFREAGKISVHKGQSWIPLLDACGLRPSDDTASLIGMILSLTLLNGPRNTSRNHWVKLRLCR